MDLLEKLAIGGSMHLVRYFFIAGLAYLFFYVLYKNKWVMKKIQSSFPNSKQIRREITYSLLSILIFVLFFGITVSMTYAGFTRIYMDFHAHSALYFAGSVALLIFWHDTYFYWTHRLLHVKAFARFHRLHHKSHNTTPWTSFAFHPIEACVQAAFIPIIVVFVPFHPIAIGVVITWQMIFNVMGHLGYEIFPVWFHNSVVGRFFNTSTHHNMHHQYAHANYGLYFNVWDSMMKTNHERYEEAFEEHSHRMYGKHITDDGGKNGVTI